jgi:hypothetical protein
MIAIALGHARPLLIISRQNQIFRISLDSGQFQISDVWLPWMILNMAVEPMTVIST